MNELQVGQRVVVEAVGVAFYGAGVVVALDSPGYVGVRFDGESTWHEWPAGYCWRM